MKAYLDICKFTLENGISKSNRTANGTIGVVGKHADYDLRNGFPIVTTKKTYWKQPVAEMLCFMRGEDNDKAFRDAGCKVWTANANENPEWLANPSRKGEDDLGGIYGVQARRWPTGNDSIDQLRRVYNKLKRHEDDRRVIVSHWNVAELGNMALAPCHVLYQFGIQGEYLDLSMYQRSCDMPLGVPFNIIGYAWLLQMMAQITGLLPGTFHHFMHDVHIYDDQVDLMKMQVQRDPLPLPTMHINPNLRTLDDVLELASIEDFSLDRYLHRPAIDYPFSV